MLVCCWTGHRAKVLFEYSPENDDELQLNVGEIITDIQYDAEDGWLEGSLNGRRGVFPDNFVEILPDEPAPDTQGEPCFVRGPTRPVASERLHVLDAFTFLDELRRISLPEL